MVRHQLPLPGARARPGHRRSPPDPASRSAEFGEARALGIDHPAGAGRPGHVPAAGQARPGGAAGLRAARPPRRLLVPVYADLLVALADAGAGVGAAGRARARGRTARRPSSTRAGRAYRGSARSTDRPRLLVASYFGQLGDALPALAEAPVEAVGARLSPGPATSTTSPPSADCPARRSSPGVVDGRNIWLTDLARPLATAAAPCSAWPTGSTWPTSCSLLHVPLDLAAETRHRPADLRARLAFARQKIAEVVAARHAAA